jgi:hypothetical protein
VDAADDNLSGSQDPALLELFELFALCRKVRDGKMKFQNFEIAEIWLLEMKFEMGHEILK